MVLVLHYVVLSDDILSAAGTCCSVRRHLVCCWHVLFCQTTSCLLLARVVLSDDILSAAGTCCSVRRHLVCCWHVLFCQTTSCLLLARVVLSDDILSAAGTCLYIFALNAPPHPYLLRIYQSPSTRASMSLRSSLQRMWALWTAVLTAWCWPTTTRWCCYLLTSPPSAPAGNHRSRHT